MEMSGEQEIAAPRDTVWAALNDPDILKQAIPGCQSIDKTDNNAFSAKVKVKVGPVNATFAGNVTLENLNPPESYTITGEGSGGAAGFAKGGADVRLEALDDTRTKLTYDVKAQVGGKLAQVGQRLIKSTANKYAKQFFDAFTTAVEGPSEDTAAENGAAENGAAEEEAVEKEAVENETAPPQAAPAATPAQETQDTSPETETPVAATPDTEASAPEASQPAPKQPDVGQPDAEQSDAGTQPATPTPDTQSPNTQSPSGIPSKVWIGGLIALVLILLAIFAV